MWLYVKLLLTAFFWGATFIAARYVAPHAGPFSLAFLRFAAATLLLLALTRLANGSFSLPPKKYLLPLLILGLFGIFGYNVLFFKGLSLIEAGRASLIIATCPIFLTLASALFLREKITPLQILGILLSVSGAALVITHGDPRQLFAGAFGWGETCLIGCVLCWVVYAIVGKKIIAELTPLVTVTFSCLLGALALLPPALADGLLSSLPRLALLDWAAILYLALFGTVIGFVWFYQGVHHLGPTRAGLFINFVPLCALLFAWLLLDETLTFSLAAGAALVVSGAVLTNKFKAAP